MERTWTSHENFFLYVAISQPRLVFPNQHKCKSSYLISQYVYLGMKSVILVPIVARQHLKIFFIWLWYKQEGSTFGLCSTPHIHGRDTNRLSEDSTKIVSCRAILLWFWVDLQSVFRLYNPILFPFYQYLCWNQLVGSRPIGNDHNDSHSPQPYPYYRWYVVKCPHVFNMHDATIFGIISWIIDL